MQIPFISVANKSRQSRWINPLLVILLLWGAMAFAIHTHHDDLPGHTTDAECQICLFATLSGSAVAQSELSLVSTQSLVSSIGSFAETLFIRPRLRIQEARAPPFIS